MYNVSFKETARKEFYSLPKKILSRVASSIDNLSENPRPQGVKKLKGQTESLWRIRIGDYRVIYAIDDKIRIINIRRVGHRRDIYEDR